MSLFPDLNVDLSYRCVNSNFSIEIIGFLLTIHDSQGPPAQLW